jgi:hypothetical protein
MCGYSAVELVVGDGNVIGGAALQLRIGRQLWQVGQNGARQGAQSAWLERGEKVGLDLASDRDGVAVERRDPRS